MDRQSPIGVFDSGLGGLTVAREIMRRMPDEKIVYFGDTARVPYGSKSKATITHYSRQIVNFLKTREVKAIVVACNTASALVLDELTGEVDVPMIGVVKPGALTAVRSTKNNRIGVTGTESLVNSGVYIDFIRQRLDEWCADLRYKDCAVNMLTLSRTLSISKEELSIFFDQCMQSTFRIWLSEIRFNAAKKMMLDYPDYSNDIISAECGFSARTYLYRVFKTKEGCTPAEWREEQAATRTLS